MNNKLKFCCMVITHEPLHLDKQNFVQWKIVDIRTSFTGMVV
jgi:hypothetical protein